MDQEIAELVVLVGVVNLAASAVLAAGSWVLSRLFFLFVERLDARLGNAPAAAVEKSAI